MYRETHNAHEILYREGKNHAVHSLPTAFIKLSEESEKSFHGLWSLSNVYELYRRAVSRKHKPHGQISTEMKKILMLLIVLFNYQLYSQEKNKEDFDQFFEEFSFNENFQKTRIKFPLLVIRYDNDQSKMDSSYIKDKEWIYNSFYFRTEWQARGQIYDSFRHELRDTDERVFEWKGIGNGVHDLYFFKRINGKWYLIKNLDYSN